MAHWMSCHSNAGRPCGLDLQKTEGRPARGGQCFLQSTAHESQEVCCPFSPFPLAICYHGIVRGSNSQLDRQDALNTQLAAVKFQDWFGHGSVERSERESAKKLSG